MNKEVKAAIGFFISLGILDGLVRICDLSEYITIGYAFSGFIALFFYNKCCELERQKEE